MTGSDNDTSVSDESARNVQLGRPRDPAIDVAILNAARTLLMKVGYNRLSLDMVARNAGVTRPTVYRRWPSKPHLVYEAVFPYEPQGIRSSGDLAADITEFVTNAAIGFSDPHVYEALPGLVADFRDDRGFQDSVIHDQWNATRTKFAARLDQAASAGEISRAAATDAEMLLDIAIGGLIHHVVTFRNPPHAVSERLSSFLIRSLEVGSQR